MGTFGISLFFADPESQGVSGISRVSRQIIIRLMIPAGSMAFKNERAVILYVSYTKRFCGFPMGVSILPAFAAEVSRTMVIMRLFSSFMPE